MNPAKLSKERRDMVCEACHTDGKDIASVLTEWSSIQAKGKGK